ncbi:MAG: hypothetical protein JOZ17_13275 [Acetobacteraceae bacterium]|nr:hypothetical protein [Acetobacteraceae bacterium]
MYRRGSDATRLQKLNSLGPQSLTVRAHAVQRGGETVVSVQLENPGSEPALAAKLTAVHAQGPSGHGYGR